MVNRLNYDEILEFAAIIFNGDEYTEDEKNEFYLLIREWYYSNR